MKYTISWIEEKLSAKGSKYAIATVTDEKGGEFEGVTIFGTVPGFSDMKIGTEIEGKLAENNYKGKVGWKFEEAGKAAGSPFAHKTGSAGIQAAVRAKAAGIEKAQGVKADGIKISATARDATLITIELLHGIQYTEEQFKSKWQSVRQWLWANFDTTDDQQAPPF